MPLENRASVFYNSFEDKYLKNNEIKNNKWSSGNTIDETYGRVNVFIVIFFKGFYS